MSDPYDSIAVRPRQAAPPDYSAISAPPKRDAAPARNGFMDVLGSIGSGAERAAAMIPGAFGDARDMAEAYVGRGLEFIPGLKGGGGKYLAHVLAQSTMAAHAPNSGDVIHAVEQHAPMDIYYPKTKAGQIAERLSTAGVGAATGGGSLPTIALRTAVPVAASMAAEEGGKRLGLSPEDQALAGNAAGMVAGVGTGMATGAPKGSSRIFGNQGATTAAERAAAVALMKQGEAAGFRLTLPEAIDHVTKGRTSWTAVQRYSEGTPAGRDQVMPIMADRPQNARSVMAGVNDAIAPAPARPDMVGPNAQEAAGGALRSAEQARTVATKPLYDKASPQPADPQMVADVLSKMDQQIAGERTGLLTGAVKKMRDLVAGLKNPTVGELSTIEQHFNEVANLPVGSEGALMRRQAGALGEPVGQLGEGLAQVPDQAAADALYRDISREHVTPLQEGPLGAINRTSKVAPQTAALYPNAPALEGQPQITAQSVGAMGQPGADLTRQHLASALAESTQDLGGKPNQAGPSRFSSAVAGNPLQRETLMAGVGAANKAAVPKLAEALDLFDASGRRLGQGSPTVEKSGMEQDVQAGGSAAIAGLTGASKRMIADRAFNFVNKLRLEVRQSDIARAVAADPEYAAKVLDAADAARGNTAQQRALIGALVGYSASKKDGQ